MRSSQPDRDAAWTANSLRELFAASARAHELDASLQAARAPHREAFENAAAVLASFDPAALQPYPPSVNAAAEGDAVSLLHDRCDILPGPPGASPWTLRLDARRAALLRMGGREQWADARAANPQVPGGGLQAMLDRVLLRGAPPLEECDAAEVEHLLAVVQWLDGILPDLPPLDRIRSRAARLRLTAPFHAIAAQFQGREKELADLRDYVGVMPAQAMLRGVKRQLGAWLGMTQRGPLLVHGVGGIGKSTLLAKFLLDHAMLSPELSFPFAYLDCDSPRLRSREPLTLLAETCTQVAAQYPEYETAFHELGQEIEDELFERGRLTGHATQTRTVLAEDVTASRRSSARDDAFIDRFLRLLDCALRQLPPPDPAAATGDPVQLATPLLLVLDTFEEMQFSSAEHLDRLWQFFGLLQQRCHRLRVVASGRSPATDREELNRLRVEKLQVGDLDRRSAREFLRLLGITEPALRARIQGEFGGNPLTLRLVADALRRERSDGALEGLQRRSGWWSFTIDQALVQGQLYRRILNHLPGDLAKLAHPGLVLRRIDAAVIQHVLARPCGIDVPDERRARALLDALRSAAWLVTLRPDGSLGHRQDMRQIMLRLIRREKKELVDDIHRLAVAFYENPPRGAGRNPIVDRAEEIYHRLQLEHDPDVVDARWLDGVDDLLRDSSIDELPARSQVYLASRLGMPLPPDRLRAARLEDRERHALPRLRSLIYSGAIDEAREMLAKFGPRSPTSPLHLIEAQVLLESGRMAEAEAALDRALHAGNAAGDLPILLEAAVLGAEIAERQGQTDRVIEHLEHAVALAIQVGNSTRLTDARLRLLAAYAEGLERGTGRPDELRSRMAAELAALTPAELQLWPEISRRVLAALAEHEPGLFLRGLGAVGFGTVGVADERRLAHVVQGFLSRSGDYDMIGTLTGSSPEEPEQLAHEWVATLLHHSGRGGLDDRALRIAAVLGGDSGFRTAAAGLMRAGAAAMTLETAE